MQNILLVVMAIIVIGLISIAIFLAVRMAWRNRLISSLVLAGLIPGLAAGYYFGLNQEPTTKAPSPAAESSRDQRVVIPLQTTESKEVAEEPSQDSGDQVIDGDTNTEPQSTETTGTTETTETTETIETIEENPQGSEETEVIEPVSDDPTSSSLPEDLPLPEPEPKPEPEPEPELIVANEGVPRPRVKPIESVEDVEPDPAKEEADLPTLVPPTVETLDPRMQTARDHMELGALIVEDHPGGAISSYVKGLAIYEELEAYPEIGRAQLDLGYAHVLKGEFGEAQNYSLAALEVANKIDDDFVKIRALINLGFVNMNKREPGNALIFYNQALAIAEKYGNSESLATLLENIGYAYAAENQPVKSREYLVRAMDVGTAVGATNLTERVSEYLKSN
jgi:hypothetical protein